MSLLSISEFATDSVIPKRVLRYLHREGIILDPLSLENQICLHFLEQVWGSKEVLRPQLTKLSMKARLNFIRTADFPSKWERYAYSRFRNQKQGGKLPMTTVVEEIEVTFGFRLNKKQKQHLQSIRNRAQVARHRQKKWADKDMESLLQSANQ